MRKFMTIFVAVVLCVAALTVFASAKNTNCTATSTGVHDWTAWKTVTINEDGSSVKERSCACGRVETETVAAPHKHSIAYVPAAEACHVPGSAELWYCTDPECGIVFADEELTQVTNRKNLEIAPVCELAYVPATEACHAAGSAEFWYCPKCDAVYADAAGTVLTNRKNLEIAPATELVYHEAVAACHANGYKEYWYCPKCDGYFADAAGTQITNIKNLTVEGDLSKLQYTAKVEATATENGMNEYWYCAGCNCFFTDAEGKYNIAYLSLTIPATGETTQPETPADPGTPDTPGSPDTGDNSIFFIVAVVAVATLGVAAVSFKKREEN